MKKFSLGLLCLLTSALATSAWATNGFNLAGYGPIASGMGGASSAYDNGLAAMMNNPATIGLMGQGGRFEIGAAMLAPNLSAEMTGQPKASSTATSFFMPAVGGIQHSGNLVYGLGFFSQGGMGADFAADSYLAYGSNENVRSELGIFRVMLPVAYNITPDFVVGGTVDYVRAGLDLKMAMNPYQFVDISNTAFQYSGTASGNLVSTLGAWAGGGLQWARFDFSNTSPYTQEASNGGFAAKLGAVYRLTPELSVGGSYHMKTTIGEMVSNNAKLTASKVGPSTLPIAGQAKVLEFALPASFTFGAAFRPMEKLLLVADYKYIGWSSVMKNLKLNFVADSTAANGAAAGQSVDIVFFQNWEDQTIVELGGSYEIIPALTIRAGMNIANNPIPEKYTNPLFAAIIKNEYSFGAGYELNKKSNIDFCFNYTPEVSISNPTITGNTGSANVFTNVNTRLAGYAMQFGYGMTF